jgi:XTP/dITP diphosphohydrolase
MVGSCNNYRPSGDRLLLLATTNQNKFFEIRTALGQLGIPLCSLRDFPQIEDAPETGSTFAENAEQKANYYWHKFQKPVMAEDSGLVIPSLGGFPGIHSARIGPDDNSRIGVVLDKLKNPDLDRNAYYICSIMLIVNNTQYAVEGRCDGSILEAADGTQGFGYDPIFLPHGALRSFGRMSIKEKSQYSHRAQAVHKIIPYLISEFRKIPA